MVGNALAPVVSPTSMTGTSAAFNGTTTADFFDASKWIIQSYSLATPGWTNNLNDSLYIKNSVRGGCTCSQVLPMFQVESNTANSIKNSITFDYNAVIVSQLDRKAIQVVQVFDCVGRLMFVTKFDVNKTFRYELKERLSSGMNLIRVTTVYNNGLQDVRAFKYTKNN
jgi:hypothetical protein